MKAIHQILILASIVVVTMTIWLVSRQDSSVAAAAGDDSFGGLIDDDNFRGVKHVQIDEACLIETSPNNFALVSPQVAEKTGWKVISVNGNDIKAYSAGCQCSNTTMNDEQQAAVTKAKQQLHQATSKYIIKDVNIENSNSAYKGFTHMGNHDSFFDSRIAQRSATLKYSLETGGLRAMGISNSAYDRYIRGKKELLKLGKDTLSYRAVDLPSEMLLLFVDNSDGTNAVVTFVYKNGDVKAKPVECLSESESRLVEQVREEFRLAETQGQN